MSKEQENHPQPEGRKEDKREASLRVRRFDRIDAPARMVRPFTRTDEGFLRGRAVVTNVGVFFYQDGKGGIRRELRLPEDVFEPASLDSLKLKPITNDHPREDVNSENIKKHGVGSTGGNPSADGWNPEDDGRDGSLPGADRYHLSIDMVVTGKEAVTNIEDGKRALSAGYWAEMEEVAGVWMGTPYDAIQRNIRYNHVAIVDRARAGDAARIQLRLDSADAVCIGEVEPKTQKQDKGQEQAMELKKILLDGVEYQAEGEVLKALNAAKSRIDVLEKTLANLEGERDTLKDQAEQLKKDLEAAKSTEKVDQAVEARLRVLDAAKRSGVKIEDGMDDAAIKKAVVLKVFPNADKAKLDTADPVYLDARFDGALESLRETQEVDATNREDLSDLPPAGEDSRNDSDSARGNMVKSLENAWKGEEGK